MWELRTKQLKYFQTILRWREVKSVKYPSNYLIRGKMKGLQFYILIYYVNIPLILDLVMTLYNRLLTRLSSLPVMHIINSIKNSKKEERCLTKGGKIQKAVQDTRHPGHGSDIKSLTKQQHRTYTYSQHRRLPWSLPYITPKNEV